MKWRLYDGGLVRRLRNATKQYAKRSKQKVRQRRWWKKSRSSGTSFGLAYLLFFLARLLSTGVQFSPDGAQRLLNGASIALAGLAMSQAAGLRRKLTHSEERAVSYYYPLSEADFFDWSAFRYLLRTWWILIFAVLVYVFAGIEAGQFSWLGFVALGLTEWLIVLSAVFLLVRYTEMIPKWLPLGFYVLAGVVFLAPPAFRAAADPLGKYLPTGWPNLVFAQLKTGGWWTAAVIALIPFVAIGVWGAIAQLRSAFLHEHLVENQFSGRLTDLLLPAHPDPEEEESSVPETEAAESAEATVAEVANLPLQAAWHKARLDAWSEESAHYVMQGNWRARWSWETARWIERLAGWTLGEREKREAQFLIGRDFPHWSERWSHAVIATAAAFVIALPEFSLLNAVAGIAAAASIGLGVPILGGRWAAMDQGYLSGKFAPIHACYPLSYRAASLTIGKINVVRTLVWSPLGILLGVLGAWSSHVALWQGAWMAGRGVLAFVMIMPLLIAGKFSRVTNDTANLHIRAIPLIGVIVIVFVSVLVLVGLALAFEDAWSAAFLAGEGLIAFVSWWAYGIYFERGRVDLLREQR